MSKEFFRWRSQILSMFFLMVILALTSCRGWLGESARLSSQEISRAEQALQDFFSHLHQGEYQSAADLYGGSYDILVSYNPDLDPADHPALWERACTINGFQCLRVGELLSVEATSSQEYTLTVTFLTDLLETYQLGPCCGADAATTPPQTEFTFRVARDRSGQYKVLDLPVYVP